MSVIRLSLKRGVNCLSANILLQNQQKFVVTIMAAKNMSTIPVTKNITLLTNDKAKSISDVAEDKPLSIMHAWLLARPKHIKKYADIYLAKNFNVLTVNVSPWQLLWPQSGTQVVAGDLLKFLTSNFLTSPLFLHGFSVGGYVWSETLVKMSSEQEKYKPLTSRFVAQVWDSAADINDIPDGMPKALFPKNPVMETAMRTYVNYHMRTFDKVATCHYIRGSQMFHTNFIRTPCLFMVSARDPIGKITSNQAVRDNWEAQGMEVYWKDWVDSHHVGHFIKYRAAYTELLDEFLDKVQSNLIRVESEIRRKQVRE
ncbi:uncharacterized protein l(2)k09913 [Atheta coriaria]|uniref:uncharacterized protein l(2)k09913 n=1 Tax=Dalotia coriaria TaxID=877792 RepID=UPI0031F42C8C